MIDIFLLNLCFWGYSAAILCLAVLMFIANRKTLFDTVNILLGITIIIHFLFFAARYFTVYYPLETYRMYLPINALWEASAFMALCMMVVIYGMGFLKKNRILIFINMIVVWGILLWVYDADKSMPLIAPPYQTLWMSAYAAASIIGYSFMAISFLMGVLYAVKSAVKVIPGLKSIPISESLPETEELSVLVERFIYYGFPLLTLGIIFRSYWANLAWGEWWLWSGEEIWSLMAWLIYMLYFYLKGSYSRMEKLPLYLSMAAFAAGIMSYFSGELLGFNMFKNF